MTSNPSILLFAPHYWPGYLGGGPITTLRGMIHASSTPERVRIITRNHDLGTKIPLTSSPNTWRTVDGAHIRYVTPGPVAYLRALLSTRTSLPTVVYINSFFDLWYGVFPVLASKLRIWRSAIMVVAPRGELHPGALSLKAPKKRTFLKLAQILGIYRACHWHASNDAEAQHIRAVFGEVPVAIRANETARLPGIPPPASVSQVEARLTYFSRIDRKKGLHVLLQAMAQSPVPITLDVYGEASDTEYLTFCEAIVEQLSRHVEVHFLGAIPNARARDVLNQYDALLLPTRGENFGHVIAEALSASTVPFVTPYTPWTPILGTLGSTVTDLDPATWLAAIQAFTMLSPDQRHSKRLLAHKLYSEWLYQQDGSFLDTLLNNGFHGIHHTGRKD